MTEVNDIDKTSKKVGRFLRTIPSKSTYHKYKSALKYYFDYIKENPDEYIVDVRRLENDDRFDQMDIYEKDIEGFWSLLIKKNKSPITVNDYVGVLRVFFAEYHIIFEDLFWKKLRRRGQKSAPITREEPITSEVIEKILTEGTTKINAMVLMMASSGMRIGELLQLTPDDVDFGSRPTKIFISGPDSKNKTSRITFISDEATRHLKAWLEMRDDFLQKVTEKFNKTTGLTTIEGKPIRKSIDDDRIFPFSDETVRSIWNRILRDKGLGEVDNKSRFHKYRIHGLRKFFRRNFVQSASGKAIDACEQLMGHLGYLNGVYHKISEEALREEYIKAEEYLLIKDRPILKPEAKMKIEILESQVKKLMKQKELDQHFSAQNQQDIEKYFEKKQQEMQERYDRILQNLQEQFANLQNGANSL